jgi:archaellum biogenesis ATPase FlaH
MADVINYNKDLQQLFLEMMLNDAESFARVQNIFNPQYFDRELKTVAKFIKDYANDYKKLPDIGMVKAKTGVELKSAENIDPEHYNWFLDEFEKFSRHKALEGAILTSADMLEKGEYGAVEEKIKEAVEVGLTKDLGIDYFADPRGRLTALKDNHGKIATGWSLIDQKLFGGFNRGELNLFAGGSGAGKSLFLQNLAVNWVEQGLNVIYITLELSELLCAMRIDCMISRTPAREVFKNLDTVETKVKMKAKESGKLIIKYLPSGSTSLRIRTYIKEFEIKHKVKCDAVLVDYLDLMMPVSKRVSPSDLFVKDKYVSEELRNLAVDTDTLLVTASQLNRDAVEEIEFDHSHIAGGLSKIQTSDNVIGIFTSRAMRERGRYQVQFMKTRSSSGVGQKVDLDFDVDCLRIADMDEDDQLTFSKQRTNMYAGMKRSSTVSPSATTQSEATGTPVTGSEASKVTAKVASKGLRDLISSVTDDDE